jgi:small-conductance mechanosensitive channel
MKMQSLKQILQKIRRVLIYLFVWTFLYPVAHFFAWVDIHLEWVNDTWVIGLIIGIAILCSQLVTYSIHSRWKIKKEFAKAPNMLIRISDILIYIIAIKMILLQLDMNITPLLTAFGVTSIAIGLAMQSSLSDFFAGLQLISDPMIQLGDFVEINDLQGTLVDITWRSTHIKTFANNIIVIPNATVLKSVVTNYNRPEKACILFFSAGISYRSSLEKAESIIRTIANQIQEALPKPCNEYSPTIRYKAFGDSNIDFTIGIKLSNYLDTFPVRHDLIKALKKQFDLEHIEISYPCRNVYVKQDARNE